MKSVGVEMHCVEGIVLWYHLCGMLKERRGNLVLDLVFQEGVG